MSGMHFEEIAADYATSRPPYPRELYELLEEEGVIRPGTSVLEVGAGSGVATRDIVAIGSRVTAVEPGRDLARLLLTDLVAVSVIEASLEDVVLPDESFDAALAATSMHWVDLRVGLPKLHAALQPGGSLAVWRHYFTDEHVTTPFRRRVQAIADARSSPRASRDRPNGSSMAELAAGGWFHPVRTEEWRWSIAMDTDRIRRLFRSFPDWTDAEVDAVSRAADELGGTVTEHYRTVLHLLRRAPRRPSALS